MTPIAIQTLDRPEYFIKTLSSLERSGTFKQCSNVHIFDCGSSRDKLSRIEDLCLAYNLELHKYYDGKLSLNEGVERIDTILGEDFLRVEDDVLVCKNWYLYAIVIMDLLENWDLINLYSVDSWNMLKGTDINNIHRKGYVCHYGICLMAFKHGIVKYINNCAEENGVPFDIAMSLECGWYEKGDEKKGTGSNTLCVHVPSLAQHIGNESKIGAPFHEAPDFVGENFNALTLLK